MVVVVVPVCSVGGGLDVLFVELNIRRSPDSVFIEPCRLSVLGGSLCLCCHDGWFNVSWWYPGFSCLSWLMFRPLVESTYNDQRE